MDAFFMQGQKNKWRPSPAGSLLNGTGFQTSRSNPQSRWHRSKREIKYGLPLFVYLFICLFACHSAYLWAWCLTCSARWAVFHGMNSEQHTQFLQWCSLWRLIHIWPTNCLQFHLKFLWPHMMCNSSPRPSTLELLFSPLTVSSINMVQLCWVKHDEQFKRVCLKYMAGPRPSCNHFVHWLWCPHTPHTLNHSCPRGVCRWYHPAYRMSHGN